MPQTMWIALLLALVPGAVAWLTARQVVGRVQDPALPELLQRRAQRGLLVGAACTACILVLAWRHAVWAVPLLAVGVLAAAYPVRRAVWGETWSFRTYLWRSARALVGQAGFWLLLIVTPALVWAAAPYHAAAAAALVFVLLLWEREYVPLWLRATGAEPLPPDRWPASFAPVLGATKVAAPVIHRLCIPGAVNVVALALPDARRHGVLFGQALLDGLDDAELAAVLAHELAHLEAFDARTLRRIRIRNLALVVVGALLPVLALEQGWPPGSQAWFFAWPVVVLLAIARRASRSQAEERRCDARAAELLGGDARTMASALVRLHALAHVPRRWPRELERQASHPSLARRLQALRALDAGRPGGDGHPALAEPVLLRTEVPGRVVLLDALGVVVADGVRGEPPADRQLLQAAAATLRATRYDELGELCLVARRRGRVLRATDRAGRSWEEPIVAASVEDAQRALDVADAALGPAPPPPPLVPPRAAVVGLLLAVLLGGSALPALLPLVLGLFTPRRPLLLAGVAMAVVQALVPVAAAPASLGDPRVGSVLLLTLLVAVVAVWLTRGAQGERSRWPELTTGAALAAAGIGAAALVAWVARDWSSSAVAHAGALWVALATVGGASLLLAQRTRLPRLAGVLLALGGVSLAALHATAGARRPGRPSTWASAAAVETARAGVPLDAATLRLSPGAAAFAVQLVPEDEAYADEDADFPSAGHFAVGRFGGALRTIRAHDVAFAGDGEIVTLTVDSSGATLRLAPLAAPDGATWTRRLPVLAMPRLHVETGTRRWTVLGLDGRRTGVVRHRGVLGDTAVREERWADRPAGLPLLFASAPVVLSPRRLPIRGGMIGTMVSMSASRWEAWRVDATGPAWIGGFPGVPLCGAVLSDDVALCMVAERGGTSLWRVDARGIVPTGWVPDGEGSAYALTPAVLLPGGRGLLTVTADGFAVSEPGAAHGLRLRVAGGTGEPRAVAAVPAGVALLATRDGVATVTRYATPPASR